MRAFVAGTWSEQKAAPFRDQGVLLGRRIAEAGLDLSCGPGTGIARHVIDGFRSVEPRGLVRYYLPMRSEMESVGELVGDGADEIIQTEFDYPMRNVWQVKQCDGLFALTGGDGTLEELLPAIIDYQMPVAIVEGAGTASRALRALVEIYEDWAELVQFVPNVEAGVEQWLERVIASSAPS